MSTEYILWVICHGYAHLSYFSSKQLIKILSLIWTVTEILILQICLLCAKKKRRRRKRRKGVQTTGKINNFLSCFYSHYL